jgi:uncharacterized protein (TIGR02996 family)
MLLRQARRLHTMQYRHSGTGEEEVRTRPPGKVAVNLEHGFLQAILECPDDDTSRLVYADWLEETQGAAGADRAEFIRVQVELATCSFDNPRRLLLEARERALLRQHAATWRRALPRLDGVQWGHFERGFVGAIWTDVTTLRRDADTIFNAQPIVSLWLGPIHDGDFTALTNSRWLARIQAISLRDQVLSAARVLPLAETTHATWLRRIYLLEASGPLEPAVALLRSPRLAAFRHLHLCHCRWSPQAVRSLAGCASLTRLTSLDLSSNALGDESVVTLAASPHLANLEYLNLSRNLIGSQGAHALAHSLHLGRLFWLDVTANRLDADGIHTLRERFPLVRF